MTLWTILAVPVLFTVLCVVVEVGRLWQARVQLENALEAAALAAIQEWGQRGGNEEQVAAGETLGKTYALANAVQGRPVDLEDRAVVPAVAWAFGTATPRGTAFDFTPDPRAKANLAVVIEATARVPTLFRSLWGAWAKEPTVTAGTAAYYDQSVQPPKPRLIRIRDCVIP